MTSRKSNGKTTPRTSRSQRRTRTASKASKTIELEARDVTNQEKAGASPKAPVAEEIQSFEVSQSPGEEASPKSDLENVDASKAEEISDAPSADGADKTDMTEAKDANPPEVETNVSPSDDETSDRSKPKNTVPPVAAASAARIKTEQGQKGGFGSGLMGGLLGGVAVVALSYLGVQQGMISLPADNHAQAERVQQLSSVQEAVAALEKKVASLETASSNSAETDLSPLETRIGDVENSISSINTDLAALTEKAAVADNIANSAISKLTETDEQSADIASSVAAAATLALQGELEGINGKLDNYGRRLDSLESLDERLTILRGALDGLEAQVSEQADAVDAKLKEAESQLLAGAERRVNVLVADLSNLDGRIAEMHEQIAVETEALVGRVTALEENNLSARMQSSAYTIALAGLENGVASGANFKLAFDTFANVASESEALDALAPYAESGVPTAMQLAASFEDVYEKVLREAKDAGEATLLDKFLLNAQNLVKVRSLDGERKGNSLTSKLGAVDYHLRQGDLIRVLESWDALPPAAKEAKAGMDWVAGLRGRIAADAAIDALRLGGKNAANGKES